MKPWQLALLGFLLAGIAIAADTTLLTVPAIRNSYVTYVLVGPAALLAIIAIAWQRSWGTVPLAVLTLLGSGVYSIARFYPTPREAPSVKVGDVFPDFSLPDQDGKLVALHDLRRTGPVVLLLNRGGW